MNLYAVDMDTCPKTDAILTRYDCSGYYDCADED